MERTEAKARLMHVFRSLIVDNVPLDQINTLKEEAYTEVVKDMFFINRKF